jgi:hypothetical protein
MSTDPAALTPESLAKWAKSGGYTRIIVHERGYFLVDPNQGARLYAAAVERLSTQLGESQVVIDELKKGDPSAPEFGVPITGDLVPWTSQPADLPEDRAPAIFHMAVFVINAEPH